MTVTDKDKQLLIDVPMPIVTPRLVLRPAQTRDGLALNEARMETWDMLSRWMPWAKGEHNADTCEIWARRKHAEFILRDNISLIGVEKETSIPVIWTGLHRFDWSKRHFQIGYWVRKSAQGHGYATETTNAIVRYAFNALGARRVEIDHAEGNDASRRVIEKLRFEREGIRKQHLEMPDGSFANTWCYARLNTDNLPPLDVTWGTE